MTLAENRMMKHVIGQTTRFSEDEHFFEEIMTLEGMFLVYPDNYFGMHYLLLWFI